MAAWMLPVGMMAGSMVMGEMNRRDVQAQNKAQAKSAAAQTQFSPWTKMGAGQADYQAPPSTLGAGAQGAMSGLSMQQAYNQAQTQEALAKSQIDLNNSQQQYYTGGGQPQPNGQQQVYGQSTGFSPYNRPLR